METLLGGPAGPRSPQPDPIAGKISRRHASQGQTGAVHPAHDDLLRPAVVKQASSGPTRPLNLASLLQAIWFRKFLVLFLGLPAAALGAIATMLFARYMMPGQFTTAALLRVSSVEPRLVFATSEKESDFKTYRAIQATLIKSPLVLGAALQNRSVQAIPWVASHPDPATALEGRIKVDYPGDSEILRLSLSGERSNELAPLVNAVVDSYLENVVNHDRWLRSARLEELQRIYGDSEAKVRERRERLSAVAEELGTGDTKVAALKQQLALEHFAEVKREHARISFDLMRCQSKLRSLENSNEELLNTQLPDSLVNEFINKDPTGSRLLLRVNALSDAVANYERVSNDPHELTLRRLRRELKVAQDALDARQKEVRPSVAQRLKVEFFREYHANEMKSQQDLALLAEQEKQLRELIAIQTHEIDKLGVSSFELESLRRETDQMETVVKTIGGEIEALRVELQSPPRVTLLQRAEIPRTQEKDRSSKYTIVAALGIFGCVVALLALREFAAGRIYCAADVKTLLGLRVVGELPRMDRSDRQYAMTGRLAELAPDSPALESAAGICAVLLREGAGASRVVVVAGAARADGKSLLAGQLALGLARAGQRTLLIDADMLHASQDRLFGLSDGPGFSDLLLDRASLDDVLQRTTVPKLLAMSAGHGDREAVVKALAQSQAEYMFRKLRDQFDSVVVDTTSLLAAADPLWIGRCADHLVLSIRNGLSRLASVHAAHERLKDCGIRPMGAVVHDAPVAAFVAAMS